MSLGKKNLFPKKDLSIIIVLLVISLALRLYQLGNVPNGLTVDEADMGYNSYSIIKTKADVYGKHLPLFFQSLDDYKAAFGIYVPIPAILIFGLSEFSIRLIPAILGSITPILIYFLLQLLYPKNRTLALIAAILAMFAPWNIQISRANLPYIQLIFFYLIFSLLFFSSFKKPKLLLLSGVFLGLTLYVYYAAIIYLPLIFLFLFLIYREHFLKNIKLTLAAFLVLLIFFIPAINHYQTASSRSRLNAISVLTPDITLPTSIKEIEQDQENNFQLSTIFHNRRLIYFSAMLDNYFDYFNPDYLFVNSKNIRYFYINNVGLFYLIELPFFIYGFYLLIKRRSQNDLFVISLLLIGPIPAMITLGSPFPHRGILLLLSIQLITAVGISLFLQNLKKFSYSSQVKWGLVAIYSVSVYFFLHQYFVHSPREFTSENDNGAWFSTVRDAIPKVNSLADQYQKVVFTWSQGKLVPAVYFLFYNQINPQIMQKETAKWVNETPSYRQIYDQIANIEFRPINWEEDQKLKNALFIGYPEEFDQGARVIDKTYLPNGGKHFLLVESR